MEPVRIRQFSFSPVVNSSIQERTGKKHFFMVSKQKVYIVSFHDPTKHGDTAVSVPIDNIPEDIQSIRTPETGAVEQTKKGIKRITVDVGSCVDHQNPYSIIKFVSCLFYSKCGFSATIRRTNLQNHPFLSVRRRSAKEVRMKQTAFYTGSTGVK
jgi:hypothetical protein